jgi:hypothetical protein
MSASISNPTMTQLLLLRQRTAQLAFFQARVEAGAPKKIAPGLDTP